MEPPRRTRLRGPIQDSLKFSRLVMGGPSPSGTHQRLPSASPQTKYGAFPLPWFCCQGLISTVHRSDCRSALTHFADTSTYRARRSQSTRRMAPHGSSCWGGDDSLLFPPWLCQRSTPSTPLGSWGLPFQALHPFRGLRRVTRDSAPSGPPCGDNSFDAAGFASCCGPLACTLPRGARPRASTPRSPQTPASCYKGDLVPPLAGLPPASHCGLLRTRLPRATRPGPRLRTAFPAVAILPLSRDPPRTTWSPLHIPRMRASYGDKGGP